MFIVLFNDCGIREDLQLVLTIKSTSSFLITILASSFSLETNGHEIKAYYKVSIITTSNSTELHGCN